MPDDKLPSINDFLNEEDENKLPSVEEFIAKEELNEEDTISIEDANGNPFLEVTDVVKAPEWSELIRMVNDVRESIPDIPEVRYYDDELKKLEEHIEKVKESIPEIPEIPEVKDYDNTVDEICEQIDLLRSSVKDLPEIKYYDEQIDSIEDKVDLIQQEITNLPQPKYYESDLQSIKEEIETLKSDFPKWVFEGDGIPDLTWIGRTFSVIDGDVSKVQDQLQTIKDRINFETKELSESIEKKSFETSVDIQNVADDLKSSNKELKEDLDKTTEKIYKELKTAALRIWEHHKESKDDDRKLRKQILGEYNILKQNVDEKIEEFNSKNIKSQNTITDSLREYFNELKEEITNLPEYNDDIVDIRKTVSKLKNKSDDYNTNIAELYKIIEDIKSDQKVLTENAKYGDTDPGRPDSPDPKQKQGNDPLTPTDQKFATLKDLAANYRLFVNRVEQQLYTIGGGGAGFVKDLDDVNIDGLENGNALVWNSSTEKWDAGEISVTQLWAETNAGLNTTKNVGIATTARSEYNLYVGSGTTTDTVAYFDGHISVAGSIFSREVIELESLGIITARSDLHVDGNTKTLGITTLGSDTGVGTVHIGVGTTALLVDGDARITGILTVGRSSITIDGDNNQINVGLVTVSNSTIVIGENVTLDASATGINSAPNVLYVAKDGVDTNNGTSIDNAFLTISAAVGAASSGTTIKVLSGKYTESNPISVPAFVSIVGDDQRTVEVTPSTTTSDLFHVRKAVKLANMTFTGHVAPAAAVAFPTDEIAENVGGGKWKGPYIQNCTSDTTTGTGVYVDGDQARLLKSMNVDAFTQYNQGGIGVAVTNGGFAQLVSLFTICTDQAVRVDKGGQADIANSNCSFGTKGLVAKGVSDLQYTGFVTTAGAVSQDEVIVNVDTFAPEKTISNFVYDNKIGIATVTTTAAHNFLVGMGVTLAGIGLTCEFGSKIYPHKRPYIFTVDSIPSTTSFVVNVGISTLTHTYVGSGSSAGTAKIDVDRPYDGQMVYFDQLYKQVKSITVTNGGSGYTSTPTVTLDDPSGPNGETATAFATLDGETIDTITIISSGSQYTGTPDVTISGGGGSGGAATASMDPLYYVINSSTPVSSGITTLTLATNLLNTVGVGSTAYFQQQSKIIASSHTFEYVGAGNLITEATPKRGGVLDQKNEVITEDGGKVLYTSTDQAGNFRIGDDLQIDQETGTISGRSFSKSLFSEMTPFILALS